MLKLSESKSHLDVLGQSDIAVVFLHGLGSSGYDFLPWIQKFFPEGQIFWRLPHAKARPVTWLGGEVAPAWYDLFEASIRSKEDVEGLELACNFVHDQLNSLSQLGCKKIILAGFSQGAALALHAGLKYDKTLAGIAAFSGYLPQRANLQVKVPQHVWLSHGAEDQVLPMIFHELSESTLQGQSSISLSSYTWPTMAHEISDNCSEKFKAWFNTRVNYECKS